MAGPRFWVLVLVLLVVLIAAAVALPALGVLVAVVGTPAFLVLFRSARRQGRQPGRVETVSGALATAGAVLTVVVTTIIAFVAVCVPVGFTGVMLGLDEHHRGLERGGMILLFGAWPLGIVATVFTARSLYRRLFPR
jgi:hypothetical protein